MSQPGLPPSATGGDDGGGTHPPTVNYYRTPHEANPPSIFHVDAALPAPPSPPSPEDLGLGDSDRRSSNSTGNSSRLITPTSANTPHFTARMRRRHGSSGHRATGAFRLTPTATGLPAAGSSDDNPIGISTVSHSVGVSSHQRSRSPSRGSSSAALPRFARGQRSDNSGAAIHHHQHPRHRRAGTGSSHSRHSSLGAGQDFAPHPAAGSGGSTPAQHHLYGSNGLFTADGRHSPLPHGNAAAAAAAAGEHHGHTPQYTPSMAAERVSPTGARRRLHHRSRGNTTGVSVSAQAWHWGQAAAAQPQQQQPSPQHSRRQRSHQGHRHARTDEAHGEGSSRTGPHSGDTTADPQAVNDEPGLLPSGVPPSLSSPARGDYSDSSTAISSPATAGSVPPRPTPTSATSLSDTPLAFPHLSPVPRHGNDVQHGSTAASAPTKQGPSQEKAGAGHATASVGGGGEGSTGVPVEAANRQSSISDSSLTKHSSTPTSAATPHIVTPTTEFERSLAHVLPLGAGNSSSGGSVDGAAAAMWPRRPTRIPTPYDSHDESQHPITTDNEVGSTSHGRGPPGEEQWREEVMGQAATQHPMRVDSTTTLPGTHTAPQAASSPALQQQQHRYGLPQSHTQGAGPVLGVPRSFAVPPTAAEDNSDANAFQRQQSPPPAPHIGSGHHLVSPGGADFVCESGLVSGDGSSRYSLAHSTSNSRTGSPPSWEGPAGAMDRAYTITEVQMTLHQQRIDDARMQDALHSLGVGTAAEAARGWPAGTAMSAAPSHASSAEWQPAAAGAHALASDRPHFSVQAGLVGADDLSATEALIDWSRAYIGRSSDSPGAAHAISERSNTHYGHVHPPSNDAPHDRCTADVTATAGNASIREDPAQQQPTPIAASSCGAGRSFAGHSIFRSTTAPSAVAAMALEAGAQTLPRGGPAATGMRRSTVIPGSPPTTDLTEVPLPSPPPAPTPAATAGTQHPPPHLAETGSSAGRRATSSGVWQCCNNNTMPNILNSSVSAMNNSVLLNMSSSFNMSTLLDPLAASMVMQQNRTALVAELKRRRQRLQRQLAQLQKEATAHNIFALIRASNASQVQRLLQEGLCSVNDRDYNGCTPLHVAAGEGNQAMVRVLLSFGADVLAVDNSGRTALDCAAANRHSGVGRYLLTMIQNKHLVQSATGDACDPRAAADLTTGFDIPDSPSHSAAPSAADLSAGGGPRGRRGGDAEEGALLQDASDGLRRVGSGWVGIPDLKDVPFAVRSPPLPAHRSPGDLSPQSQQPAPPLLTPARSSALPLAFSPPDPSAPLLVETAAAAPSEAQPQQEGDHPQQSSLPVGSRGGSMAHPRSASDGEVSPRIAAASGWLSSTHNVSVDIRNDSISVPAPVATTPSADSGGNNTSSLLTHSHTYTCAAQQSSASPPQLSRSFASTTASLTQCRRSTVPHGSSPMRPVMLSALHSSAAARSRELIAAESLSGTTVSSSSAANSPHPTISTSSTFTEVSRMSPNMRLMLPPSAANARAAAAFNDGNSSPCNAAASAISPGRSSSSQLTSPATGSMQGNALTALQSGTKGSGGLRLSMMGPSAAMMNDAESTRSTPPTLHDRPIVSAPPYLAGGTDTPLSEGMHDTTESHPSMSAQQPHQRGGEEGRGSGQGLLSPSIPSTSFDVLSHGTPPLISSPHGLPAERGMDGRGFGATPPYGHLADPLSEGERRHALMFQRERVARQGPAGGGALGNTTSDSKDSPGGEADRSTAAAASEGPHQRDPQVRAGPAPALAASAAAFGVPMLCPFQASPQSSRGKEKLTDYVGGSAAPTAASTFSSHPTRKTTEDGASLQPTLAPDTGSWCGVGAYQPFKSLHHEYLSVHDVGEQSLEEHRQHFRLTATTGANLLRRGGASTIPSAAAAAAAAAATMAAAASVGAKSSSDDGEGGSASALPRTSGSTDVTATALTTHVDPLFAAAATGPSTTATSASPDEGREGGSKRTQTDEPPANAAAAAPSAHPVPSSPHSPQDSTQPQTGTNTAGIRDSPTATSAHTLPQRSSRHAEEQHLLEQVLPEPLDLATLHHSSYTTMCDTVSMIVCMVGLPGRGKSFIGKRLVRYMNWKGVPCRVFNAGDYRRQLLGVEGTANAAFFDPNNPQGAQLRERMAELACEDLVRFIASHALAVGILDATNTTRKRRAWLSEYFQREAGKQSLPYRLLFIESVCTDDTIITENILRSKCDNDDFKNVSDVGAIIAEFRSRISQYEKVYETCEPAERTSYIKIINVKHHVILHHVPNGLGSRIAFFLLNLHPIAFPIYIALPGETVGDKKHIYGGEERLTARGEAYAVALKNFIQDRYVPHMVVLHATNYSVLSTLAPLMGGATVNDTALILQVPTSGSSGNVNSTANTSANRHSSAGTSGAHHTSTTGPSAPPPPPPPQQQQRQPSTSQEPQRPPNRTHQPATLFAPTSAAATTTTRASPNVFASPTGLGPSSGNVSVVVAAQASDPAASEGDVAVHSVGADPLSPTQHRALDLPPASPSTVSGAFTLSASPASTSATASHRGEGEVTDVLISSTDLHAHRSAGGAASHHSRRHRRSSSRGSRHSRSRSSSSRTRLPNTEGPVAELHPYSATTTIEAVRAMAGGDLSAVPLPILRSSVSSESTGHVTSAAVVAATTLASPSNSNAPSAHHDKAGTEHSSGSECDEVEADSWSSSYGDGSEAEMCDEVLCPVPGLDNINYGRFSGHAAAWVKEKYPRLSAMLYEVADDQPAEVGEAGAVAVAVSPSRATRKPPKGAANPPPSASCSASSTHTNPNDGLANALPPPVHYATHSEAAVHLQHAPTGVDPRLSYCIQFPNGESCRQVNVRLEPALMAVMRTQSPVFVVAPAVPAQGVLAFFMDVIPELSPTLRIPNGCVVEIGVKNGITVHPLLPDSLPASMTRSPLTALPPLQSTIREVAATNRASPERNDGQPDATASLPSAAAATTLAGPVA
ncbi:putative 6-phosphofructo-2-kinase/fructose-2 6-biphosphatase [Leptomonas seymouri]|uniref:Putative 6-phosphofructo-2-kinase/fructose-2 6-biphosphatase n=1 Tax=Leptomonas seymouri TaxID=5684 RepID=A0A0N0P3Y6_LEPSE|nr:putative 6-phosphofructo-2-kinase/fructose-2 6-biphosphatase [Leptomonas seymouri]|eukprot:KPI84197.1 putative 6-phosphofructo-2-kinase/fructose-2 6-biphosphatase [Leptomonas seymouri]